MMRSKIGPFILSLLFMQVVICSSQLTQEALSETELNPGTPIIITKCETAPLIDGRLDDDCWNDTGVASDFVLLDKDELAGEQTIVYITYDDETIYFGFACDEPNPGDITANETEHDAQVCDDDCVEVFLDLNRDYKNYFHFIVNAKGVTSDASVELVDDFIDLYYDWEPEYDVSASIGAGHWYVEIAIPFASLMTGIERPSVFEERKEEERCAFDLLHAPVVVSGTVWNINLNRRKPGEQNAHSSWSPTCDKFYMPYQFGSLVFGEGMEEEGISALISEVEDGYKRTIEEKHRIEKEWLRPILDEISAYTQICNWVEIYRRNLFMGYESEDGKIRIPNYARLDGQGRVVLSEAIPPLSEGVLGRIIAKETPRFVYDNESLAELREKVDTDPNVESQWLELKVKADELREQPLSDFVSCDMQTDRNCISREHAINAGAGYGSLSSTRTRCAFAYAITRDRMYAEKAWQAQSLLIDHFEKYQVFRSASNWYSIWDSSYEVFSSTYFYDMVADSGVLTRDDKVRLIEFIRRIGYRVDYCVKHSEMIGNHQFMWTGNFGCMVSYFPEFPEHERWARDVEDRMPMLYADILTDGGQIERSPGHHIYGLSFLCKYVTTVKQLTGENIFDKEYDGKSLEMTLDCLAKICTPLGEIPAVNDSKRPRLSKHLFILDIIDRFDKGKYLRAGKIDISGLPLEHLVSDSIEPVDPDFTSVLLPDTGWAVMRDGWDEDSGYLLFDYGGHGAWHGHYDKMNIIMYADGVGWVLDAGASPHYCVYIEEHNEWHKQTIAHNTVMIDNKSQDAVTGTLRRWMTQNDFDLVSASHDGYEGFAHTRTVFHPRGEYFIISDFISSSDSVEHDYSWLLHVYAEPGELDTTSMNFTKEGKGLLVLPAVPNDIASLDLEEGLCIDTTGERKEPLRDDGTWTAGDPGWAYIPYVSLNKSSDAQEVNYIVVLFPYEGEEQPDVQCLKLVDESNNALGIRLMHNGYEDIYGEKKPGVESSCEIEMGGIQTDADYFFVRIEDDKIVEALIIDGTYMFRNGEDVAVEVF